MRHVGENLLRFVPDFTVIDLETTGRSNKFEDITEISAIRYRNYKPTDSYSTLIKAKNGIIPFVVELTGITDAMIADAPSIESQIEAFVDFIGSDIILGHNVTFDYFLIYDAYLAKTGIEMHNDFIDTLRISRLMNRDVKNHKLETLCTHFGVVREVGHRGLEDSQQTAQVYIGMRHKYISLREEKRTREGYYERI